MSAASGDYKEKAQQFAGKLFNVIGDYVANESMLSPLVSAIKHIEDQGYQVGFKLSDVRTNKGIEYNANKRFYSASTIKAPFVVSLAEQYPEKIAEHRPVLEAIAKQSSNSGYAQLQERYGHGVIHHWADQSGINRDRISRRYPDLTPEELHALWESNYEYIQEGAHGKQIGAMFETPNLSPIKSVLGQSYKTQSKAGWIGDWEYRAANDAGIVYTPKGDYIVSIMSNSYGNLGLLNPLVKALNQLHQKL